MRNSPDAKSSKTRSLALFAIAAMGLSALVGITPAKAQGGTQGASTATGEFQVAQLFQPRTRYRRHRYQRPQYRRPSYRRSQSRARTVRPAPVVSTWKTDESNQDPVQIVVSLPDQKISVYKGEDLVTTSRVSSGKAGHRTPSGVFSILEKRRRHFSNLYGGAPMPHMQRLTWSGVALHASDSVPGYPASHGCVRLRPSFARQLFAFTQTGAHVIIANEAVTPALIEHDKLFQPAPKGPRVAQRALPPRAIGDDRVTVTPAKSAAEELASLLVPEAANAATPARVTVVERTTVSEAAEEASTAPIRILVTRRTGRERILDVQQVLADLGYAPGDIDGFIGGDTTKAIKSFQSDMGLATNGAVTDELIGALYVAAGKGKVYEGHIYVRQDFKPLFDAPVTIREPGTLLGTHVMTAMHFEEGATKTRWLGMSLKHKTRKSRRSRGSRTALLAPLPDERSGAKQALDRIDVPVQIRERISKMLRPGTSLVISDKGIGPETGKGTDFIALTN